MAAGRGIQTGVAIAAAVVAVLLGACLLLILAMTSPAFATPVTRAALAMATGQETRLDSARLRLGWPLGFEIRGLQIANEVAPTRMGAIDGRLNPFGFLPGVSLLPLVQTSEGALAAKVGGEAEGRTPGWLAEIDMLEAEAVEISLAREGEAEADLFVIDQASGRLAGGDLELVGHGGGATVFFDGGIAGPFVRGIDGAITLRGDNLAEFAELLGLAAPDTPPYEWNARLSSGADEWRLNGITGTVGDSDLAGDIVVRLAGERPFIDADLRSDSLDFDDVGLFVGAPTQIEGEAANELQVATNQAFQQSDRLIPDATLDLSRIRAVDAEVDFQAASVRAGGFPMQTVTLHMNLDDGVMRFDPLEFTMAQGHLVTTLEIDASGETVATDASGQLDGMQLADMAAGRIGTGEIEGRFTLAMTGDNLRRAAGSAGGDIAMWVRDGAVRKLAEEAADLDIGEALLLLMSEDAANPELEPLRCGVMRFNVEQGVARAEPVVFDSTDSLIAVEGRIDFNDESLDIAIDADNKDVSWGQLLGDVTVGGTMRRPQIAPELGPAVAQGGLVALLGALAGPLAALPFFNPEEADNAPCAELLARAQQAPAAPAGQTD